MNSGIENEVCVPVANRATGSVRVSLWVSTVGVTLDLGVLGFQSGRDA